MSKIARHDSAAVQLHAASLSKDHREILIAGDAHATYEEIASSLGLPVGTVKSRLNRARKALDKIIREQPSA